MSYQKLIEGDLVDKVYQARDRLLRTGLLDRFSQLNGLFGWPPTFDWGEFFQRETSLGIAKDYLSRETIKRALAG